jgi:thiamine biosynthesis protein ThiI
LLFIVRYSEIGLKGENRGWFEEVLAKNLRDRLLPLGAKAVERRRGRLIVPCEDADPAARRAIADALADTPGVRSFSPARPVPSELAAITAAAIDVAQAARLEVPAPLTFRVETNRADKTFPMTGMELSAHVGGAVLEAVPGLRVKLVDPDLTIGIELHPQGGSFVLSERRDGPGGLPVGSSGAVVLLLSGGIDSPVAGMLLQKRGSPVVPVYCHAFPFTGDAARDKVVDLARALARRQRDLELRVAPIAEAQTALRDRCKPDRLVVLYRRLMVRIAERVAEKIGADALATGENLGQVASQTLPNMRAIDAAASRPILRPLATYDKEETVALAKRLGTYETSVRPADDCCQLFVPKHPATRVTVDEALAEEAKLDAPALVEACVAKIEVLRFARGALVSEAARP